MKKCFVFTLLTVLLTANSLASETITVIGTWYDDLGSPDYGDSTLVLEKDKEKFFMSRRSGDGSGSRYRLAKEGNKYSKIGDKFGAKYIVTQKGLEIHDDAGYIRTAKAKSLSQKPANQYK